MKKLYFHLVNPAVFEKKTKSRKPVLDEGSDSEDGDIIYKPSYNFDKYIDEDTRYYFQISEKKSMDKTIMIKPIYFHGKKQRDGIFEFLNKHTTKKKRVYFISIEETKFEAAKLFYSINN